MDCKVCSNQLVIKRGEYTVRCECVRTRNILNAIEWSEMPKPYAKADGYLKFIEDIDDRVIRLKRKQGDLDYNLKEELTYLLARHKDLIEDNYRLFFHGTNGHGKTQSAITLALEIVKAMDLHKQEIEIDYFFYIKPIDLVNEGKLFNQERREAIQNKIKNASVLIIDDLGEELELGADDKRKQEILKLLSYIMENHNGLIIVTSNMANPDSAYADPQKGNPRLYSRLFTDGASSKYNFPIAAGEDKRKTRKTNSKDLLENR